MKRILCISGSRADYGLLEWPVKVLRESFEVPFRRLRANDPADAYQEVADELAAFRPDCLLILGDRWEILQAAIAAHLQRVPIAHIAGGDWTPHSYDNQMRDCISILSKWHFATSPESTANLSVLVPRSGVYHVGNIALDYIMHGDWKKPKPPPFPYVLVSYQAETIDGTVDWPAVEDAIGDRRAVIVRPNADAGSHQIDAAITDLWARRPDDHIVIVTDATRGEFLNLLYHCEEFIGNSSAMLYEAPALGVKCRMIGKRQQGRVAAEGDGKASERIREVLCRVL